MRMRFPISFLLGLVVSGLLFLLMQNLVAGRERGQLTITDTSFVDFIRVRREEQTRMKQREIPKKPEPPKKPPPPQLEVQAEQRPQTPQLDINMPNLDIPFGVGTGPYLGGYNPAMTGDGDVIPIVQIQPQWPREALINGQEGVVVLEFTILEDGSVRDPRVVESDPPRIFDRNAMRAIMRWKFKPRIIDGRPVQRRATLPMEFKLDRADIP
ncbi:MAG: energy transducer TonB [Gammaproteobacteria bacterium]|nr:energy transducer TonB [Gammaproteobacteria bacterium]